MNSKKYLSDKEIYDLEVAIYNDDFNSLTTLLTEEIETLEQEEYCTKELVQGQEYTYILPDRLDYILRKDGLIINAKTIRYLRPNITGKNIIIQLKGKTYYMNELFEKAGWTYDRDKILKAYKDNKWSYTISEYYKQKLKSQGKPSYL